MSVCLPIKQICSGFSRLTQCDQFRELSLSNIPTRCRSIPKNRNEQHEECAVYTICGVAFNIVDGKWQKVSFLNEPLSNWKMNATDGDDGDDDDAKSSWNAHVCELGIEALHFKNSSQNFDSCTVAISTEIQTQNECHHKQIDFCRFAKRIKNRFYAGSAIYSFCIVFLFFSLHSLSPEHASVYMCLHSFIAINLIKLRLSVIRDAEYHGFFFFLSRMLSLILSAVKWMICKSFNFERLYSLCRKTVKNLQNLMTMAK